MDMPPLLGKQRSRPKISIVTPSYNQAVFLERAILSVINQNYPNLEYIIIDGGSKDESLSIIKKYERHLSYWVSEPDRGQSHAINKGLAKCSGDYFAWLNSDDYLNPGVLPLVGEAFDDPRVGTVCGEINVVDVRGNILEKRSSTRITFETLLNGNAQIIQPGAFHRKTLLDQLGGVDENLRYVMDYELWLRLGKHSSFVQLAEVLANYTVHPSSKTCSAFIKFLPEIDHVRKKHGGRFMSRKTLSLWRCRFGFWRRSFLKKVLF